MNVRTNKPLNMSPRAVAMREKKAARAESDARIAQTRAIVITGKCPCCGSKLRRNLALAGWWQCEQYGAPSFRARSADPDCSWQGFTE